MIRLLEQGQKDFSGMGKVSMQDCGDRGEDIGERGRKAEVPEESSYGEDAELLLPEDR